MRYAIHVRSALAHILRSIAVLVALAAAQTSEGQVVTPVTPHTGVAVTATPTVTYDATSHLYTYSYSFANAGSAAQQVCLIAIQFTGALMPQISAPTSPSGWTFAVHKDRNVVSWAATGGVSLPPGATDDGNLLPSPYQIAPGASLAGFSFQSPNPPVAAMLNAQGFAKLPAVATDVGDLPEQGGEVKDWQDDSYVGAVIAPLGISANATASPSVDGFLGILSPASGANVSAPVTVSIQLALHGESVSAGTLAVELNNTDITKLLLQTPGTNTWTAMLVPSSSALQTGTNVLHAFVTGTDPATGLRAFKVRRLEFSVGVPGATPPSGGACNGIYTGTFSGDVSVSPGQLCEFIGGNVSGNITVSGGNLILNNTRVGKDVQINGGGSFLLGSSSTINGNLQIGNLPVSTTLNLICAITVNGDLQFHNNGAPVQIGSSSPTECPGNVVGGNLQITTNTASTQVFNNTVGNSLQCQSNQNIAGGGNTSKQKQGQCSGF